MNVRDVVMFERKEEHLVRLSGVVTVRRGSRLLHTSCDLRPEIRRGDALRIAVGKGSAGKKFAHFRVSTALIRRAGAAWNAPLSVSSTQKPNSENVPWYAFPFTETVLPLDEPYDGPTQNNAAVFKNGCTNDLRRIWADMSHGTNFPRSQDALLRDMEKRGLISTEASRQSARESRREIISSLKRKKRRKIRRRSGRQSMSNAHIRNVAGMEALYADIEGRSG